MHKRRIFIVEDDPAISDIISILLRRNGYEVEEFIVGAPLLQQLPLLPDLFLLDKQLADHDGLEICRHLKQQTSTALIPVIILSASHGIEDQVVQAGADAFIEKPFTSRLLLSVIRDLIDEAETAKLSVAQQLRQTIDKSSPLDWPE